MGAEMKLTYHVVDVFTETPLEGNALAVFPDASGIDGQTMQRIARELNLSETTFVFPGESIDGAMRVRIFTPWNEMEFAGHPTIGTAYVMRRLGLVPSSASTFALAENVGLVPVRIDDPLIWLTTPPIRDIGSASRENCAAALGLRDADLMPDIPCEALSAGNPNLYICVRDAETVDRSQPEAASLRNLKRESDGADCIFVFAPTPAGAYSRMFAPELGVVEDPATGSATGPLAAFMMRHGLAPSAGGTRFVSEQGTKMGRRSLLHVLVHGDFGKDGIEIGGSVVHVATATMEF
jgi:trans-2,3-dihydro-3-hydroxyanthranilate isomerase